MRLTKTLATACAWLSFGTGCLSYRRLRYSRLDVGVLLYLIKLMAGALAPILSVLGLVGVAQGLLSKMPLTALAGGMGALLSAHYVRWVAAPHDSFERAFGADWRDRIPAGRSSPMLKSRWTCWVPALPRPYVTRDVPFCTIPGTDRHLLCDIWQPGPGVVPSGLALIYLHPGGWQDLDKGVRTRPFFRHLAAQGHLVMDVAYRLSHETDLFGMLGDVKRAIVWIKANAARYAVDPRRVVAAGGSAGGHLALLAAYTPSHPRLDPEDVRGNDTSVRAVVSLYGVPDLCRLGWESGEPSSPWVLALCRKLGFVTPHEHLDGPELMRKLLGGLPHEVPDVAVLLSPITHVAPGCPPTLLLHGSHDRVIPVERARELYEALYRAAVQVAYLELPWVEHAFDLAGPRISPSTQAALYDVERFLALMAV